MACSALSIGTESLVRRVLPRGGGEFREYTPRVEFPCIELSNRPHIAAHRAGVNWLRVKFDNPTLLENTMTDAMWRSLGIEDMHELSRAMLHGAKKAGANMPDINLVQARLMNWNNAWFTSLHRGVPCGGRF